MARGLAKRLSNWTPSPARRLEAGATSSAHQHSGRSVLLVAKRYQIRSGVWLLEQLAQHRRQDTAVAVVIDLDFRI
jgi:hypothetical protein